MPMVERSLEINASPIPGGARVTQRFDGFPGIGKAKWERTVKAYEIGTDQHALLQHLKEAVESAHVA